MKNTKITNNENQVLKQIQNFTAEDFGSDSPAWCNVHEIDIDSRQLRALISTLSQKGILTLTDDGGFGDGSFVTISKQFYTLTGEWTNAGSPEYKYINLEVK